MYMAYKDKKDQAASARRHYERNRDEMIARAAKNRDKKRQEFTQIINLLKEHPCVDCGITYPGEPDLMDFDHIRGKKIANISTMTRGVTSMQKLMIEVDKCELVCAICHRRRTRQRRGQVVR
jgi:hypothetical protein